MKNTMMLLVVLLILKPSAAKAKEKKPSLSCAYDGRNITIKIAGDLSSFRKEIDLSSEDLMLCMVGDRTAWNAKTASALKFCKRYVADPKHEYIFGPIAAFNRGNEPFALRFYSNGKERRVNDSHRINASGVCTNHPRVDMFIIPQARLLVRAPGQSR